MIWRERLCLNSLEWLFLTLLFLDHYPSLEEMSEYFMVCWPICYYSGTLLESRPFNYRTHSQSSWSLVLWTGVSMYSHLSFIVHLELGWLDWLLSVFSQIVLRLKLDQNLIQVDDVNLHGTFIVISLWGLLPYMTPAENPIPLKISQSWVQVHKSSVFQKDCL